MADVSEMDMEVDAGLKRWVKVHHSFHDISSILIGLSQVEKVQARALDRPPRLHFFYLTQPNQDTAVVMKSMMYFDPPLETSIHLHNWPCPYSTYPVIQTS